MQQVKRSSATTRRPGRGSRQGPPRTSWTVSKGEFLVAAAYLAVVALFGGGVVAWNFGNLVVILATIALAVALAWRDGFAAFARAPLSGRLALAGIAIIPLLQMVPLPPAFWQVLPGQELRRATLYLTGLAGSWQPMTLEPGSTALCAVMAIGFVVFVGWLLRVSDTDYRRLLMVALGLVLLGILVGLLQVVSDGQFPQIQADNMGATLLGFYANKNHMAVVLACSVPLFDGVSKGMLAPDKRRLAVIGYIVFVLVAIVATNSRAGLALGALVSAVVLIELSRGVALRWRVSAVLVVAGLAVAIMSSSAFETVSGRVDDVSGDLRWQFLFWTWPLAERYGLLGSGFGSFQTLFITQEQLGWVKPTIVNAVHNDYLQLLIEGGVPGIAVLVLLLISVIDSARTFGQVPRRDPRRRGIVLGLAIVALFALHSVVDYPLRRPAAWVFFALGLAALYRGRGGGRISRSGKAAEIEAA